MANELDCDFMASSNSNYDVYFLTNTFLKGLNFFITN